MPGSARTWTVIFHRPISASAYLEQYARDYPEDTQSANALRAGLAAPKLPGPGVHRSEDAANYLRGDEGLIGFKLQGYVNHPTRARDIEDIRALLRANRKALNMPEVRSYFSLFEREALLDEILAQIDG